MDIRMVSYAGGHIPRSRQKGDKWTHWKVLLRRWRYSGGGELHVDIFFFNARKVERKWVSARKASFFHTVSLGSTYAPDFKARLRTAEETREGIEKWSVPHRAGFGESYLTYPRIAAELKLAINEIEQDAVKRMEYATPVMTGRIDQILLKACLKPEALPA